MRAELVTSSRDRSVFLIMVVICSSRQLGLDPDQFLSGSLLVRVPSDDTRHIISKDLHPS